MPSPRSLGSVLAVVLAAVTAGCTGGGPSPGSRPIAVTAGDERPVEGRSVAFPAAQAAGGLRSSSTSVSGPYPQAVRSAAPVVYYRLADIGTTAADSSGNGHDGTIAPAGITQARAPLLAGDTTPSTRFNGDSSGYIAAARAPAFEPATALTVEMWMKLPPNSPAVSQALVEYGVIGPSSGYGIVYQGDRFMFRLALPGVTVKLAPSSGLGVDPTAGTPYLVVATYDGATAKLYVDAQLVASQPVSGSIVYPAAGQTTGLLLGNNQSETSPATAVMQEVAIYAKTLAAPDIARHYAIGTTGAAPSPAPTADPRLVVPSGFYVDTIANVGGARELAASSNGDLLVGTSGSTIALVPNAEGPGAAGAAKTLITLPEGPAAGIAWDAGTNELFAGTNTGVWKIPYVPGDQSETSATRVASVRTGPVAPNSDGDVHRTTSVAVSGGVLYAGVGSSCNACTEVDPTRATIQQMSETGGGMSTAAHRIRNPIALAVNPATGTVWAGGAGQDNLPAGHPYEYLASISGRMPPVDFGWPQCEENRVAYVSGADCSNVVVPQIEFPAYSTLIGAAFYPKTPTGPYAFPPAYRGGAFVSMHGSWHTLNGVPADPPHVAYVPIASLDTPAVPVNWMNPSAQWSEFFNGFQLANGSRIGRTTGVAVGSNGSLFVADDQTGNIYRIRPGTRR